MKLDQINAIVAIAEHGSLRAAARRLGLPQPALTRGLRSLEKELGVPLFERSTQGMTLTPVGRLFHQRAIAVAQELRRARDEIAQYSGQGGGSVVAALSMLPLAGMLPSALPVFRRRFAEVQVKIVEGLFPDIEAQLRNGSVDVYMGAVPRSLPAPGLAIEALFDNTRVVVARKKHPLRAVRSLKALAGAEWATTTIDHDARDDLEHLFAQHALPPPRVVLEVGSSLGLMMGLARTDLLATVPAQWARMPMARAALAVVALRERLPAPSIVLMTRLGLPLTPAAEHLCDVLRRFAPERAS